VERIHPGLGALGTPLLAAHPQVELLDFDLVDSVGTTSAGTTSAGTTSADVAAADSDGAFSAGHPPVGILAVHGFGGDKTQLRPVVDAVRAPGVPALLPSLRSHGDSPAPAWGWSPLDFTADLHRIADALPGRLNLIGYSYGALVAALSAVTWAGDRVRSLVVVDQSFDAHPDRFVADEWAEGSHLRWNYDFGHLPGLLEAQRVPVLALFARDSDIVGPRERARLRSRADGGLFHCAEIPGTHAGLLEHPHTIASAVREFHARVAASVDGGSR